MAEIKAYNKNLWYKTGYDAAYSSIAYFKSLSPNSFILSLGPSTTDVWRTAKFYLDVVPGKQYLFSCRVTFLYVKQGSLRISFGSPAEGNFPSAYGAISQLATLGTFSLSYSFTPTAPDLVVCFSKTNYGEWTARVDEIQLIEATDNSDFEPTKIRSAQLNTELFGFGGLYDSIMIDGDKLRVHRFWKRETQTTDSSGNISLSNYSANTTCIVVKNSTGEVKLLTASSTVSTGWANTEVTVIYCSYTPTVEELTADGELTLAAGTNHIQLPDFATILLTGKEKYLEG